VAKRTPDKQNPSVLQGDIIIFPAGVGHQPLEDLSGGDFEMVGSYPNGRNWDMCYGKKGGDKVNGITRLRCFEKDRMHGDDGPTLKL